MPQMVAMQGRQHPACSPLQERALPAMPSADAGARAEPLSCSGSHPAVSAVMAAKSETTAKAT